MDFESTNFAFYIFASIFHGNKNFPTDPNFHPVYATNVGPVEAADAFAKLTFMNFQIGDGWNGSEVR